jgi:hypothetical protein
MPRLALTKLRPLLTLAATLLLLALAPPRASAYMSPGEPVSDPQVDKWLAIAGATWGAAPACPQGVRIDRAQRIATAGLWAAAEMPGCHISLDPDYYPAPAAWTATATGRRHWEEQMCNVLVHEFGHLLGHDHSSDPHSVMAPIVPRTVAACRPSTSPRALSAPRAADKTKTAKRSRTRGGSRRNAAKRPPLAKHRSSSHVVGGRGPA